MTNLTGQQAVMLGAYIHNNFNSGNAALDLGCIQQNVSLNMPRLIPKLPKDFFTEDWQGKRRLQLLRRITGVNKKYIRYAEHCVDLFHNYLALTKEYDKLWLN
jgi:hypothetical protein